MKYLAVVTAVALTVITGCADISRIQNTECAKNVIEFKTAIVEIPEMEDFELTLYDKPNSHMMITHKKENLSIDIEIKKEPLERFEMTKRSFYENENELMVFGDGDKLRLKQYAEGEKPHPIGHTRYVYVYRVAGGHTVTFTQYDYTDGSYDDRVAEIIDSIYFRPNKKIIIK